ncbi:MAG: hypothetical protein C0601_01550 [Candidatus Muiribacterium halophilum]|uniref:Uncharacterized protein n=1 Tax=Muiribacterium halophilum TaxID=2053465 RepID=A0A2N5ZLP0_MUIH1|nr:MAG: hypothetical protein C0601_01550 [Candidatus Muirbacterium halophilum]
MKKYLIFLYSILYTGKNRNFLRFFLSGFLVICVFSIGRSLNNVILDRLIDNIDQEFLLTVYTQFHSILGFILVSIASMSCIIYSFNIFFKDSELYFLFSLPIKTSEVFFNRFMKIFLYSSSVYILFSAGILSTLHRLFNIKANIITLLLSYLSVPLIYTSISILIVFLFTMILGSINSRRFLISFSVFMITVITVAVRYMRPERLFQMNNIELDTYMEKLSMPFLKFSPGDIPSRVMLLISNGRSLDAITFTACCLLLSFILLTICSFLYKRLHGELSGENQPTSSMKRLNIKKQDTTKTLLKKKEITLFLRDNFNMQQLWLFIGLIAVFFFNAYYLKNMGGKNFYDTITFFFNLGVILLISASFIARFFFGFFVKTIKEKDFLKSLPINIEILFKARQELFFTACCVFSVFALLLLLLVYRPELYIILISIIDIFLFISLYINMALYISLRFLDEQLDIFSIPVLFYILFNLFLTAFVTLIQAFGMIGTRHIQNTTRLGRIGSVIALVILIVFFISGIFKRLSRRKIRSL